MLSFEIGFLDSRGAVIMVLTVFQGHLGGPGAPIRAQKEHGFVEIPANQGVAEQDHIWNRLLRLARCIDFGPRRVLRASWWSGCSNPRPKRM